MRKHFQMRSGQGRFLVQLCVAAIMVIVSQSAICGPIDYWVGGESGAAGIAGLRSHASLAKPQQAVAPASFSHDLQDDDTNRVLEAIEPGARFHGGNGYRFGLVSAASWKPQLSNTDGSYTHFNDTAFAEERSASASHEAHSADCIVNKPGPAVWSW